MKQGGTPPPRSATSDKPYLSEKGSLRQKKKKKKVWVAKIEERVGYSFLLPYLLTLRRLCDRDLSLTPPELYGELWKDFATKEPNFSEPEFLFIVRLPLPRSDAVDLPRICDRDRLDGFAPTSSSNRTQPLGYRSFDTTAVKMAAVYKSLSKRTDQKEAAPVDGAVKSVNKQRVLLLSSRGVTYRQVQRYITPSGCHLSTC